MKGKIIAGWGLLAAGMILMLSGSRAHVLASIAVFVAAFMMGSVIIGSGRLLAGLCILLLSVVAPLVGACLRLL